jgi:predicted nuclease of predicted toxin-antitoxin system
MSLLANENIPGVAVTELMAEGHDVAWVRTAAPGIADSEVLACAGRESRILLTFDKDFGELARMAKLPSSYGVILFRMPAPPPEHVPQKWEPVLRKRTCSNKEL